MAGKQGRRTLQTTADRTSAVATWARGDAFLQFGTIGVISTEVPWNSTLLHGAPAHPRACHGATLELLSLALLCPISPQALDLLPRNASPHPNCTDQDKGYHQNKEITANGRYEPAVAVARTTMARTLGREPAGVAITPGCEPTASRTRFGNNPWL